MAGNGRKTRFGPELPALNEREIELAQWEQSWCDFVYLVRTRTGVVSDDNGVIETINLLSLATVANTFRLYRERLNSGEQYAIVAALEFACKQGVPLPNWLSREILTRLKKAVSTNTTLGDALGFTENFPERGKKASNARRRFQDRKLLYVEVSKAMHWEKVPTLDAALRQVLSANRFPFSLTVARKLYLEQDRIQNMHLGRKINKAK